MHTSSVVDSRNATAVAGGKNYHCGTLTYTKAGLFVLFAWLLWGDFCFTLMEAAAPNCLIALRHVSKAIRDR